MRRITFAVAGLLSACAVGGASDDSVVEDAGGGKDVTQQKDVATIETGTPFDAGDTQDVTPPKDSGGGGCTFSGILATYDFSGELGSQTSTNATSSATNVTAGPVSRASALTATAGAGSINSSNWATTAKVDLKKYYTLSLTPQGQCTLDVTSLSLTAKASGTGPNMAAVATSEDTYASMTTLTLNAAATPSLSVNAATGAVEIRIYGWGASAVGGTMRLDTKLTVSGALH